MTNVAILTLITNAGWQTGPGHSALAFSGVIWSFEDAKISRGSGWKTFAPRKYIEVNAFRPIIVQELNDKVPAAKVLEYCTKSHTKGDGYFYAGVCSSLVAEALAYATGRTFNPNIGFDYPDDVAKLAKKRGYVKKGYYVPASAETAKMKERREEDFSDLPADSTPGFLKW